MGDDGYIGSLGALLHGFIAAHAGLATPEDLQLVVHHQHGGDKDSPSTCIMFRSGGAKGPFQSILSSIHLVAIYGGTKVVSSKGKIRRHLDLLHDRLIGSTSRQGLAEVLEERGVGYDFGSLLERNSLIHTFMI